MALCAYGFFTPGVGGGLCFGAGLGITIFGIMYMFIHDGLVHKRFPVGPIADLPYMRRILAAHQIHHMDKFGGVPFGMFLGPQVRCRQQHRALPLQQRGGSCASARGACSGARGVLG